MNLLPPLVKVCASPEEHRQHGIADDHLGYFRTLRGGIGWSRCWEDLTRPSCVCVAPCLQDAEQGALQRLRFPFTMPPRFIDPKSLIVLVTGGTAGIGEAAVRRFISAGSKVVVTGRRGARLQALKEVSSSNSWHGSLFLD